MADFYIFRTALRDLVRTKRVIASLLLIAAPASIALLWRFAAADAFDPYDAYNTLSSVVVYGFLLVILSVVFGTGVISQEIEQKTIVYLLTRPVPRWRIVVMKFLAAVAGIAVTVLAATLLLAAVTVGAGGSQSAAIRMRDVRDRDALVRNLATQQDPVSEYLWNHLPRRTQNRLREYVENDGKPQPPPIMRPGGPMRVRRQMMRRSDPEFYEEIALSGINKTVINDADFYNEDRFPDAYLATATLKQLAAEHPRSGRKLAQFNRLLIEAYYPTVIAPRMDPVFPLKRDLAVLPLGAFAYGALFLLLATLLNRPLMYGLVFAFGWESWVPNLPGKFGMVSIMTYLRALAPHPQPAAESVDLLQFLSGGNQTVITSGLARGVLFGVIVVALLMALTVFSNNEYVPREDAE